MRSRVTNGFQQTGFTLLEVLITISVLAIGLLGLAAMQVVGLRSNSSSTYRTEAVLVASSELVERMQANSPGVDQGLYDNINSGAVACPDPPQVICSDYYSGGTVNAPTQCTPAQMARYDVETVACGTYYKFTTSSRAVDGLRLAPNSTLTVQCSANPCTPGSVHVVTIDWKEAQKGGTQLTQTMKIPFIPPASRQ